MPSFRCPICGVLTIRLNPDEPCKRCHSTHIDPSEFKGGQLAEKKWQNCGLTRAFRN
jgi:uncharacterized protein YcbX